MEEEAWLFCEVLETYNSGFKVQGLLIDKSPFVVEVSKNDFLAVENPERKGWLRVKYHGQNNGHASITLPVAILEQGKRISVDYTYIKKRLPVS